MVLNYYFKEIKYRIYYFIYSLISTFLILFEFKEEYFNFLNKPLRDIVGDIYFIATNVLEILFTYIYLCVYFLYLFMTILIIYNIYAFIVPGISYLMKIKLKQFIRYFIIYFILNFIVLYKLFLYFILKYIINLGIITSNGLNYNLDFELKIKDFLFFVIKSTLISQFVFLIPLFLLLYLKFYNKSLKNIIKYRLIYYSIQVLFIIILLPPDILLHFSVILCVIGIFEFCVIYIFLLEKYKSKLNNSSFGGMVDTVDLKSPPF